MANEASFNLSLQIVKNNLYYRNLPTTFQADVSGTKGPSPGAITVSTSGTDVDLSELTTPGICVIHNLDDTEYLEYGIWDTSTFHELGEVLPGEIYILRLSRNMTGLRLKSGSAGTASIDAVVEAFEA